MKFKNIVNLLFIFCGLLVSAQDLPEEIQQEIIRRTELEINPGISLGILLPSGETMYYNFGEINDSGKKPDSLTLYEIGSITKTFTAFLVRQHLVEYLDTSLSHFFPEVENHALENIKISELRNHTSGVPRLSNEFSPQDWSDPYNDYSKEKLLSELQTLEFIPDSLKTWSYSNFGYGILGRAMEKKTGKDFERLMGELLKKAGLKNTYLDHSVGEENIAQPTNLGLRNKFWHFNGPSRYAGALISNTHDLLNYLKFRKENNDIFKPGTIHNTIPTGIKNLGNSELNFKDGWFVMKPGRNSEILIHNGGTGGFTSFIGYNKNNQTGVVILSNSGKLNDDIGLKLMLPGFPLKKPERTIAYELADLIESGKTENLVDAYVSLKAEGFPINIVNIYWLERLNFGNENWQVSDQLSDIMVEELPEDWEVWDIKGQNYESLTMYEKAEEAYQKALELNPKKRTLKLKIERNRRKANN
ncbi:serine hydrolase [Gramella lutea]|uniref:Serine hydrolase n=1 Tax=Christiangramia lutea TaxID=1607951 RepID=A0A9X2A9D8_9FLAO|nr:serine hydrolase [Christiangramia lutea]MCH4823285.1 serine hydrolase [Christiangramia lutea]